MKKLFFISVLVAVLASCSDKIYEEINTDPTKTTEVNAAAQLTYAELQLFGDMNYVDVHRLYTYAFTQQLMGCWNTTNYGGQNRMDDTEELRPWNNLYAGAMRNLTDAIEQTKGDSTKVNLNAALRIMRVYVGSLLTDFYGDVPYSEAGYGFINGNTKPKYDTQEEMYRSFFAELHECMAQFDLTQERITSDPMFGGELQLWQQLANSLCLRYAMRLAKVDEDFAKTEFARAWAVAMLTEDAVVKHMNISYSFGQEAYTDFRGNALSKYFYGNDPVNNPTYICATLWNQLYETADPRLTMLCRFYIDDFMSLTGAEGRYDVTNEILTEETNYPGTIGRNIPGNWSWDEWPTYTDHAGSDLSKAILAIKTSHPEYDPAANPRWTMPKLATNYLRSDNPGVVMTRAEICFLGAEAVVRGWISGDAAALYNEGIRKAIRFEVEHYGAAEPTEDAITAYLGQSRIAFGTVQEQQLSQINTQAWILHFHNPCECWANLRRSDYPKLKTPTEWGAKNPMINGEAIPVRLNYPQKEQSYNGEHYNEAKNRVEGGYSWNAPVWWDK